MIITRAAMLLLAGLVIVALMLVLKTSMHPFLTRESVPGPTAVKASATEDQLDRLAGGLRIPTVSALEYADTDFTAFDAFKSYLPNAFPRVFTELHHETVNDYGLILRWKGKNADLKPLLFLSHYDVVPAEQDEGRQIDLNDMNNPEALLNNQGWKTPPFSGTVIDGALYGRGALDMKGMLFAMLEAVDDLLVQNFQPEQDIWFAISHDDEGGRRQVAVKIAGYQKAKGLQFESFYDEGGLIAEKETILPDVTRPLALVGLGEKGYLSLGITLRGDCAHSSVPPRKSSLVYAAEIVEKLNDNQMPARLITPVASFLDMVGGDMSYASRLVIANRLLLEPVLLRNLGKNPNANALIRTTTALTMMKGSEAPNVISSTAEVVVNFRLLPGDTVADVTAHVQKICEGYDVTITPMQNTREASKVTSTYSAGYRRILTVTEGLYPEAVVTPYITVGGTDAYKYQELSDAVCRFMPIRLNMDQQQSIHNDNEHISADKYGLMIEFFRRMFSESNETEGI